MRTFWRVITVLTCLFGLLPAWASAAVSDETVRLVIEGQQVEPDVPPVINQGRTLVPVRVIAEGIGARVEWEQTKRKATVTSGDKKVVLALDSNEAWVNGKQAKLDTPPLVLENRILLPLRFVGEALGATVGWESQSRTVVVNRPVTVHINGTDMTGSLKSYKLEGGVFLPLRALAQAIGVDAGLLHPLDGTVKKIDDQEMVPVAAVETLLGGKAKWNQEQNEVNLECVNHLLGIRADGGRIAIDTDKPVAPKAFTLTGPDRVVIDLPNTLLADDLVQLLQRDGTAVAYPVNQAVSDQDDNDSSGTADNSAQTAPAAASAPLIHMIRYSQYSEAPATVRVVIELGQKAAYKLTQRADGFDVDLTAKPAKTGFLIVVDPGHGGKDPGAKGVKGNVEKDFTLAVTNRMVALLKQYKEFQVVATRTTDVYPTLQERVKLANDLNADLFISVHANSFKPETRGTETYYYNDNSAELAAIVHRHLIGATQFPDRGVHRTDFYVIKNTKMPAVLTESGFLTNAYENAQLTSPAFQDKVAKALVAAIREYYEKHH